MREFVAGEWLDDNETVVVDTISKKHMAVVSNNLISAVWLDWFLDHGWEIVTLTSVPGTIQGKDWVVVISTYFKKVTTDVA